MGPVAPEVPEVPDDPEVPELDALVFFLTMPPSSIKTLVPVPVSKLSNLNWPVTCIPEALMGAKSVKVTSEDCPVLAVLPIKVN